MQQYFGHAFMQWSNLYTPSALQRTKTHTHICYFSSLVGNFWFAAQIDNCGPSSERRCRRRRCCRRLCTSFAYTQYTRSNVVWAFRCLYHAYMVRSVLYYEIQMKPCRTCLLMNVSTPLNSWECSCTTYYTSTMLACIEIYCGAFAYSVVRECSRFACNAPFALSHTTNSLLEHKFDAFLFNYFTHLKWLSQISMHQNDAIRYKVLANRCIQCSNANGPTRIREERIPEAVQQNAY